MSDSDVSISGARIRHCLNVHFYVLSCLYFWIYLYLEACEKNYGKIKCVNINLCQSFKHKLGVWITETCMLCAGCFSLSRFNVRAPPLRPSLPSLPTVHNLIKGQQHSIIITTGTPLERPYPSLCAGKPVLESDIKSPAATVMLLNTWLYLYGRCTKNISKTLSGNISKASSCFVDLEKLWIYTLTEQLLCQLVLIQRTNVHS